MLALPPADPCTKSIPRACYGHGGCSGQRTDDRTAEPAACLLSDFLLLAKSIAWSLGGKIQRLVQCCWHTYRNAHGLLTLLRARFAPVLSTPACHDRDGRQLPIDRFPLSHTLAPVEDGLDCASAPMYYLAPRLPLPTRNGKERSHGEGRPRSRRF